MLKKILPVIIVLMAVILSIAAIDAVAPKSLPLKYESVEKLLLEKKIDARVYGLGGHQEECVQMEITNIQSDTMNVRIEAGRRLVTEDSSMQNILLVRNDSVRLAPGQKVKQNVYGFCCNANRHSPTVDAVFSVGYMAHPPLQKLAVYLSTHKFSTGVMQSAIWSISNNHLVAGIGDVRDPNIISLREYVARLKGQVAPWYNVVFKKDSSLCSGLPERIVGTFTYQINTNGFVSLILVDEHNMPRKVFLNSVALNPDSYKQEFNVDVTGWPRGKYFMRLTFDGARKMEKLIEL